MLSPIWRSPESYGLTKPEIRFYREGEAYGAFSNFYRQEPFDFDLPSYCCRNELVAAGRSPVVTVRTSEHAVTVPPASLVADACQPVPTTI